MGHSCRDSLSDTFFYGRAAYQDNMLPLNGNVPSLNHTDALSLALEPNLHMMLLVTGDLCVKLGKSEVINTR